jgi:hypothetical protein
MIALAVDAAEKQLRDGTASSQVITHFLKLASTRERLEQEKLAAEVEEKRARTKQIESGEKMEALYTEAIKAMKSYAGHGPSEDDEY